LIRSSHLEKRTTPGENRGQSSEIKSLALSTLLARLVLSTVLSALTGLLLLLARLLLATALLLAGLALATLVLLARILLVRIAHNCSYLDIRNGKSVMSSLSYLQITSSRANFASIFSEA
jgi:hypothetical protein